MLLSFSYWRQGTTHAWVVVGAELLLLSNYRRSGNTHVCVVVSV